MPKFYVSSGDHLREIVEATDPREAVNLAIIKAVESHGTCYVDEAIFVSELGFIALRNGEYAYNAEALVIDYGLDKKYLPTFDRDLGPT
jgi:hypothetical protein